MFYRYSEKNTYWNVNDYMSNDSNIYNGARLVVCKSEQGA